jgi:hypothetical protein
MTQQWTVEAVAPNVHIIRFDNVQAGWEQYIMLSADRHHDNAHCDQRLERAQLEKARARNAPIIDAGDLFDAMGGKWDPRRDYDGMRPEYQGNNYLDRLIDVAADFYGPYADLFAVVGPGNHETAMLKRHETDLTARLTRRLRGKGNGQWPYTGGYGGWVIFRLSQGGQRHYTVKLKYHHGAGGGGPVTKGIIKTNRRAVYTPDADVIISGHVHESWVFPMTRERVTQRGHVQLDYQWHVQLAGYKEEYLAGNGYHVENERSPKPRGCAWLRLYFDDQRVKVQAELDLG